MIQHLILKVGYERVSSINGSQETGLNTQIQILKRHGCERIFAESQSGTSTDKKLKLKEYLEFIQEGYEFTSLGWIECVGIVFTFKY